jgi:hypothetical protein
MPPTTFSLSLEQGTVLERGTEEYEKLRQCNFVLVVDKKHEPALICEMKSIKDIQDCLEYACANNMQVSIRCGGHNWCASFLQPNVLLLDLKGLSTNTIEIVHQDDTAIVGPCVYGQDLNQVAASSKLCFPSGHCQGVPMGGFLLGGGFGWFTDHFGMAAESVLGMTVVTAAGEIRTITKDDEDGDHIDWMWLARGSGCAFPGVVVSFTLQLHKLPPIVRSRTSFHHLRDAETIVKYLIACRKDGTLSTKVETTVILASTPPSLANQILAQKVCMVAVSFLADSEDEFAKHMEVINAIPSTTLLPCDDKSKDYSFSELADFGAGAYPHDHCWEVRSCMVDPPKVDWDAVCSAFSDKAPIGCTHTLIVIGPQLYAAKSSAYGDMPMTGVVVGTYGVYSSSRGEQQDEGQSERTVVLEFTDATAAVLKPALHKFNVLEHPCNKDTFRETFLDNTDKLLALRAKLDPNGRFFDPSQAEGSR